MYKDFSLKDITNHIHQYISSKGFYYDKNAVTNLFLSLKTKPFVILSGISGTGKTKIAQWLAESLGATEENGQFTLIPVRPDWNDGSDLLGYKDIKGDFIEGPLTKVLISASDNEDLPYFVVLDEMNLARVEYYFSDILSVMESKKREEGKIVSSDVLPKELAGESIKIPNNVYIIGTVNMDETTHPFSKKVLDRANTIENNQIKLDSLDFLNATSNEVKPIAIHNDLLSSEFIFLKDAYPKYKDIIERVTSELVKINDKLQALGAQVGYRVRDEICFYMIYSESGELMDFDSAFDHCIMQKILPRIAGTDARVELALMELYKLCTNKVYVENEVDLEEHLASAKYPLSAAKIIEMKRRLSTDGFTSFWLS